MYFIFSTNLQVSWAVLHLWWCWRGPLTCSGVGDLRMWDGLSRAPGPCSTWSLVLQQASSNLFTEAAGFHLCEWGHPRLLEASKLAHLYLCCIHLVKASHQGSLAWRSRELDSISWWRKYTKSHCQNRVNCNYICNKSTTVFIVGTREESLGDLKEGARGWKQGSGIMVLHQKCWWKILTTWY